MSGFEAARMVESEAMARLRPFLRERHGAFVVTSKGTLSPFVQEVVGDLVFNDADERFWTIELKAEQKYTGNLFLETWSNRNLDSRDAHAELGSNPGWLWKQRADLLFYYFIDNDNLYIFDLFKLKRWAFGASDVKGRLYDFHELGQARYRQRNDTHGRLVPLNVLKAEVGYRLIYPLSANAEAAA